MGTDRDSATDEYSGQMDPEIAELIGSEDAGDQSGGPDFEDLFGKEKSGNESESPETGVSREAFPKIEKFEGKPNPVFGEKKYYKQALGGEGEPAQRLHKLLVQFVNTEDTQERSVYRGKLISAYWNLAEQIALKSYSKLPEPKRFLLRFGYILPTLISTEQRTLLSKIIVENDTGEPFYYIDEWLRQVARGAVSQSATDEVKAKKKNEGSKIATQVEKARGQRDTQFGLLSTKLDELEQVESQLKVAVDALLDREQSPVYPSLTQGYTAEQRARLGEINTVIKQIGSIDREVEKLYEHLNNAAENLESLEQRAEEEGVSQSVDSSALREEFNTVRQMAKLCVGRQGNHVPILMKQYFKANLRDIGTRENVIAAMTEVEEIDTGVFKRTFKRQTNRIVPHVILVPCYGDTGICWEPFERYNRATSKGRVAIPMYPKDLKQAIIAALGDLRWQVAKEKAQHYWMEEGLTGKYYQWFESQKNRKGDVKEAFIQDYILWITKESEGMQKLDREVRGIFWREMPFAQDIKEKLKNRGFLYAELYKKDKNREISDGY